ncbi:MAG: glycosyltransferase [Phycisphaeraceae bacterium]|nr:glycosyltransferase [Phycisphaeraceae bacterium]
MIDPIEPDFGNHPASPRRPAARYAPDGAQGGSPPAVSVVTPYFNTGAIFHETARCILNQSLQNFEWIIVNDGSTDPESLLVLDEYRAGALAPEWRGRVRVIDHKVNHGLPAARNTGFRAARADLVYQIDADDLIEPTTLEKSAWYLASHPHAAFVGSWSVGFGAKRYLWTKGFHDGPAFLDNNIVTATSMIRRTTHDAIGGCDETIRGGMEDWDYWVRAASCGLWGGTIPEHLDWYRRRDNQHDDWENLSDTTRREAFRARLRAMYPALFEAGGFPRLEPHWPVPFETVLADAPISNPLRKDRPRILIIVPWLRMGGADRFNLDLARLLADEGWGVTIAATGKGHPWLARFASITPDVFCMDHFLRAADQPRFLRALIDSRRPDVVMLTNSSPGYMFLPFLRAHCPGPVYVDFNHMEEPHWRNGGHPRSGAAMGAQLDLSIVSSEHLRSWMISRGAEPDRVRVCYTNADTSLHRPDPAARAKVRASLGIGPGECVILYAARFCPQKQPHVFAESVARLRTLAERHADRPAFTVLAAGDGEERDALRSHLARLGLLRADRPAAGGPVVMLGEVPPERVPSLLAASDIFFLPSQWEGIALAVYEAMSTGLAVVGAAVGGQRELVTPETGLLLERVTGHDGQTDVAAEAEGYAQALLELMTDGPRRVAMAAAARRRIETHFELADMGGRMLDLFRDARRLADASPRIALPESLARETATQAVEVLRLEDLTDYLWKVRAEHERMLGERAAAADAAQAERAASERLAQIESSRSWRLVRACKSLPPYGVLARARWGRNWRLEELKLPPTRRLAMIESSRSYRLINALKSVPPWSTYVRVRYGPDERV